MILTYQPLRLQFGFAAGTSRGVMHHRDIWLLQLATFEGSSTTGRGEVAPLPGLSVEDIDLIPHQLKKVSDQMQSMDLPQNESSIFELARELSESFPSIRFGLEMAMLDLLKGGKQIWFDNDYTSKKASMPINGLIWMGDPTHMKKQIDEKLSEGFDCVKMKIGAIDFEEELKVLSYVREHFSGILRVDANGAFGTQEVFNKLDQLSQFDLHSIEQPIAPRQWTAMNLVCSKSKVPVALDEELIGYPTRESKIRLLDEIRPPYIILKPSLLGGFEETNTWIELAEERGIDWWMTSALESNLGLNAIAQFTANYQPESHQGLGTGGLFTNNLDSKSRISEGRIFHIN